MATYVNNLRLKEITTGDEDGTWGTSTNTNLELITDGFSYGTKEMAADANETFTMPDATADDTRSFYLKITSAVSLTATREVTLGPNTVSKVWMIENATSGSQIITIKQGSGATVNVPNGSKVMVVTDGAGAGAAVFNANPTEVGGTVTSVGGTGTVNGISLSGTVTSSGNLTLGGALTGVNLTTQVTGTLPVANGGTGVTSSTGTGSVVLSTNPTFAGLTTTADMNFGDSDKANFGASNDLQIYHDGFNSHIEDIGTGDLKIGGNELQLNNAAQTKNYIYAVDGAQVELKYDNALKLATSATGVTVTGTATATAFSGSGASLTSLDAGNISSGTLAVARGGTGSTSLTANNVLLGNGTSALQAVAPGTSGNVLSSNGSTWVSSAPAGGGAWELLHTTTISTLSSFITITSPFSSTYDTYQIHFDGLDSTNTSPVDFEFWFRKGGANQTSNYSSTFWSSNSGTISNNTASQGFIIGQMGNASWSGNKTSGFVIINSANTTNSRSQLFQSQITNPPPSGIADVKFLLGNQGTSGAIEGFTLNIGSGDFQAGTIKVYGLKKS